ncbi:hypothetical protein JA1_005155 [Spathaspora sp. JA1]|nr:hypothetical protein JA1_005155 [Spathaspora sp. JA1]
MFHSRKPKITPCYDIEKGLTTPYYKKQQTQHGIVSFLCFMSTIIFFIFIVIFNLESPNMQTQQGNVRLGLYDERKQNSLLGSSDYVEVAPPPAVIEKQYVLQEYNSNDNNIEANLKEIFSINPIIILSINEELTEFETVLLNLNINPKPKIINLLKHPNFNNIVEYLRNINGKNIPKLFIGGCPIGTEAEILEMNKQNQLVYYLKEKGRGLISIE